MPYNYSGRSHFPALYDIAFEELSLDDRTVQAEHMNLEQYRTYSQSIIEDY